MHTHSSITTKQNHISDINTWRNNQPRVSWIGEIFWWRVVFTLQREDKEFSRAFLYFWCFWLVCFFGQIFCVEFYVCVCIYRWKLDSFAFNLDCFDSAKNWWNWDAIGNLEDWSFCLIFLQIFVIYSLFCF
jgi:hypothetical protein